MVIKRIRLPRIALMGYCLAIPVYFLSRITMQPCLHRHRQNLTIPILDQHCHGTGTPRTSMTLSDTSSILLFSYYMICRANPAPLAREDGMPGAYVPLPQCQSPTFIQPSQLVQRRVVLSSIQASQQNE